MVRLRTIRLALMLLALIIFSKPASAQTVQDNLYVTDGKVYATVRSGNTIYIGGDFTSVNPVSGSSVTRNRLAAFDAVTGAVTSWNPDANAEVFALAVSGTTIYAGGKFTNVGGAGRNRIAALNNTTGSATGWNPNANDEVYALAVDGTVVFAGGKFIDIGGQSRDRIAKINSSGNATGWNPNANEEVRAIAVDGGTVYVGGKFNSIAGSGRNRIAAVSSSSGNITSWNPNANDQVNAIVVSGSAVYVGGKFNTIGGQNRNRIAALNNTNGNATGWNPNANAEVNAIAVTNTAVYIGGQFSQVNGQTRNNLAAIDVVIGNAYAWNPNPNNTVHAVAFSSAMLYAGGEFSQINAQSRPNLVGLSAVPPPGTFTPAPIPGGEIYHAVVGTASGAFIAVGDNGQIRYTLNNGVNWLPKTSGTANALLNIAVANNFNPALGASRGAAVQSGQSPNALGTAVACGVGGTILRSTDGGDTWINENDATVPDVDLYGIAVASDITINSKGVAVQSPNALGTAVACGVGGTILRSTDGGETWSNESTGLADLNSITVSADFTSARTGRSTQSPNALGTAVACGVGGTILRSTDGGDTWIPVSTPTGNELTSVSSYSDGTLLARRRAGVEASHSGGRGKASHSRAAVQSGQSPNALGTAISCGVGGTILRSTDGGLTWSDVASGTTENLHSAQMASDSVGYISGGNGTILRSTDAGLTWENLSPSSSEALHGVFVHQYGGVGMAVGTNGAAFITLDGGGGANPLGDTPLPVELAAFSGSHSANGVSLNWLTASEKNNAGFFLMRDGFPIANYGDVPSLRGQGTTTATTQYTFTDAAIEAGNTYLYTLRSIDYSGLVHDYPQAVSVEVKGTLAGTVYPYSLSQNYPNPFNPQTVIAFSMKDAGQADVAIYDGLGRLIERQTVAAVAGNNQVRFNGSRLASGMYFYRLTATVNGNAAFTEVKRMTLMK